MPDRQQTVSSLFVSAALVACSVPGEIPVEHRRQAATVCAEGPTIPGIDVSAWQGDALNWDAIAAGGDADFAFIRASHGLVGDGFNDGPDAHFDLNWAEAGRVGMLRGAYQYFISTEDPIEQANFLIGKIGPLQTGDLPPVIDVEVRDVDPVAPVPEIIAGVGLWLEHIESELGVAPIIYTSQSMWNRMTENTTMFAEYPLWTAHYDTECPLVPGGWNTWTFHQYGSTGGISGYAGDIDKNKFMGTLEELQAMATQEEAPAPDAGTPALPEPDAGVSDEGPDPPGDLGSGCSTTASGSSALLALLLLGLAGILRRRDTASQP